METAFVVWALDHGYLMSVNARTRSAAFSTDVFDAMIFDKFRDAQLAQQFVCWTVLGGRVQVSINPFPASITIGG